MKQILKVQQNVSAGDIIAARGKYLLTPLHKYQWFLLEIKGQSTWMEGKTY